MAVVITALAIVAVFVVQTLSFAGWQTVAGARITDGDRVDFELHYSGGEAVLVERRGTEVVHEARCTGTTLVENFSEPSNVIVREGLAPADCFRFATSSVLGFARARTEPGFAYRGTVEIAGRTAELWWQLSPAGDKVADFALDRQTGLPLEATSPDGLVTRWTYTAMNVATGVVPTPGVEPIADEKYVNLSRADLARALGIPATPDAIAGLPLVAAMSYMGGELDQPSYFAMWTDSAGREVRVNVGSEHLSADSPTLETLDGLVILSVPETGGHVEISATDPELLRDAVAQLRPRALSFLP